VKRATATLPILIVVGLVLWGSIDTGVVGQIADGRQMIFTAVAISESGSLGQARGRDLTMPRAGGDAVSRYGLGMSLAQLPAAASAPAIEAGRGPGSSQWVFLVAPFVFVLACGLLAARIARDLGGGSRGARAALLLATVASPFGVYAAMELSEPLQALAITAAFAFALRAATVPALAGVWLPTFLAGVSVGVAILTKSSLVVVAPLALTPLLRIDRRRASATAITLFAGLAPVAAVWLYFELARFGRPFAGYGGESFSHPFLDGAWRLLIGPNKGLLLYFPAAVIAVTWLVKKYREDVRGGLAVSGVVLPTAALWMLAAPWWAWHGVDGWGPRLVVPGVPLLAAAAALELGRWRTGWRMALIGACLLINVPPLVQHPTPVVRYMWICAWPAVDTEAASGVPPFARREVEGRTMIPPDQVLASTASASPFVLLPWFFRAAHSAADDRVARLNAPPWLSSWPGLRPTPPLSAEAADAIVHPAFAVYDAALGDQVLRAQQLRDGDRALALAWKFVTLAPSGYADALLLESFRLLKRKSEAIDWLTHLPLERRQHPAINIVLALWDRDEGKEEEARALLQSSAPSYPGAPLQRALQAPLSAWPADFAAMTADPSLEVRYN
jgi:dolichyl-phosphate-mannose-protein mannosyltransferase